MPAAAARSADETGIGGSFAAGMESYVFDLESDLPADFGSGGGTTATTDSCSMACGVPWVLCDAMRMFASTKPGGVDGDADEAGLVDVEYDCSGVSGVSGLVGGLGYAEGVSTGVGVGFGGDVDGPRPVTKECCGAAEV